MKSRVPRSILVAPLALYPMMYSSTAMAQSAPVVDVCTGLSVDLPVLQPVGGILDLLLQPLIGAVNTNIVGALSGQNIGVSALDSNGNVVTTPGDCNVSSNSVTVDANTGISMGGGTITGLGGTANAQASAGEVNSIALGNGATTAAGAANALALGLRGSVSATDGVALGRDTNVTAAGGVALGAGSVASRAGMNGATEAFSGTAVASTAGAISVGTVGGERQITNVAGGTQDTDAVNLRQLRTVNDTLTTEITNVDNRVTAISGNLGGVAAALGGGASYDSTTNVFVGPSYTLRGNTYTDVGTALAALDGAIGGAGTGGAVAANNASGRANAAASGSDSTALGYGAQASHANSTAVGNNSQTTRDNQIMLGTSTNTYTMPGVTSAASRAAQVGPTQVLTTDAAGNIASVDIDLNRISSDMKDMRKEARQGIAAAMAMTSAPTPSAPGKTAWAGNVAAFKGEMATSFAMAHTFDASYPVTFNASVGYAPGGSAGVRMGLSGEF